MKLLLSISLLFSFVVLADDHVESPGYEPNVAEYYVSSFKEKSSLDEGWINGGFFVIEPEFLKFIKNDNTYLEREPLEKISKKKQLAAFKHNGFWQCMDTKRDKDKLDMVLKSKKIKF